MGYYSSKLLVCMTLFYTVILRTTKWHTALQSIYYKALLQYYSVLLCITKYNKTFQSTAKCKPLRVCLMVAICAHEWNDEYIAAGNLWDAKQTATTTLRQHPRHMKRPVGCAEQSAVTLQHHRHCPCHAKRLWWLHMMLLTYETSFTMRGATRVTIQHHQKLRLPRKNISAKSRRILPETAETQCAMQWRPAWSDTNPKIIREDYVSPHPPCNRGYFSRSPRAFCEGKNAPFCAPASDPNFKCRVAAQTYSTSNITKYCTCQEKLPLMIDPRHRWKVLYLHCTEQYAPLSFNPTKCCACHEKNIRDWPSSHIKRETLNIAQCNRRHHPTPSNIAPVTQNDLHDWSSWHMECPVQCTKQQRSPSNITKYDCIRQEERLSWLILFDNARSNGGYLPIDSKIPETCAENRWNVFALRERSYHDPRIKPSVHTCLTTEVTFSAHHGHFVLKNKRLRAPTTIPNFIKWSGTPTLPNTAFAMQIILMIHNWSHGMETSFTTCGATKGTRERHHQIVACQETWPPFKKLEKCAKTVETSSKMKGRSGTAPTTSQESRFRRRCS